MLSILIHCICILILLSNHAFAQQDNSTDPFLTNSAPGWQQLRDLENRLQTLEKKQISVQNTMGHQFEHNSITPLAFSETCQPDDDNDSQTVRQANWLEPFGTSSIKPLSWNKGPIRITPFGYISADMLASERAYTLLAGPLFLLPAVPAGVPDSRYTFSAQQTTLGLNLTGPNLGSFESSGTVAFNFFGDRPVQNNPGVFFLLGYLELKNDRWRFWAGQDGDAIARQNSNSPSWASHKQSGNFGQVRPGFRAERTFLLGDNAKSSIYFGLTQQVVLDFIASPQVAGTDNGWPNVEFRWEINLQNDPQEQLLLAVGGLIGETRAVDFAGQALANVSTTWAIIPEIRFQFGCIGFQGELFLGDALGTYNGAIGQSLNILTDEAIYTIGGFGELFCDVTPDFTVAIGYGLDDPRDTDLAPLQRSRNETYWTNAIWRLNDQWETRFEIARLKTNYITPNESSKAMQYLLSVRYYF